MNRSLRMPVDEHELLLRKGELVLEFYQAPGAYTCVPSVVRRAGEVFRVLCLLTLVSSELM